MRGYTTTALVLTTLASLALTGCSDDSSDSSGTSPAAASSSRGGSDAAGATPLSSAALSKRLLTEQDLGVGYVHKAERAQHDDEVSVVGCPALAKLGGDAATGGSLDFPRKAKAAFTYGANGTSEVSEELYSDTAPKLSDGVDRIFDAMACPKYQVVSGSAAIDVTTQTSTAPADLGEEQWSHLLTYSAAGRRSVVKQTAIRAGNIVVVVAGSPALVDAHLDKALAKARSHS
ncbi:hypothetical protein ACFWPU_10255 [Streptomyces sp. NPDC058471]|uniref:hypothetical protein n=1 Tax=Streptomyces sp. NPDC058471 TaxID=3346516 RepID=UPI00365D2EEB